MFPPDMMLSSRSLRSWSQLFYWPGCYFCPCDFFGEEFWDFSNSALVFLSASTESGFSWLIFAESRLYSSWQFTRVSSSCNLRSSVSYCFSGLSSSVVIGSLSLCASILFNSSSLLISCSIYSSSLELEDALSCWRRECCYYCSMYEKSWLSSCIINSVPLLIPGEVPCTGAFS